ncbi:MAG TPA: hypothetical protein VFC79_12665, partial [Tissierellaceae bacterium]|nr:hypothetical protein [Tissierellaceae bacterium]
MKIARLRNKGELELKNEIIEYPPELEGNRNLFTGLYTGHANHPNYNIDRWTGAVVKIKPNTIYTVKRETSTNRFQIMTGRLDNGVYALMTQVTRTVGNTSNAFDTDMELTITSGGNDEYLVVYLSNQGHFRDILLKVEEGSNSTSYTPSPEELGLEYPDFIKSFNQKIYPHGVILTPEIVEYPPELEGGRNLIKSTDDLHSWNGVVNVRTTTGAFLYTSYNYRPAIYQIEARATDENMVGAQFAWQWSSVIQGDSIILSKEWQRVVSPVFDIDGAIGLRVLGGTGKIELRQIKAERGNKVTPWTPALEDLGFNYSEDIDSFGIRPFGDMTMVSEIIEDCSFGNILDFGEILEAKITIGSLTGSNGASSSVVANIPVDLFPLYYDGWHEFYDYDSSGNTLYPRFSIQYDTETSSNVSHDFVQLDSDGSIETDR